MWRFLCGARSIITSLLLLPAALTVNGQTIFPDQLNYVSHRTSDSISIDGRPLETAWQKAPWSEAFGDIEGSKKPRPTYQTRVKMLWNEDYLFIFAELEEPHIQASLRKRDTIIYHDNDFEVFIDPNGDTHQYYEIEVNAHNTILDLFMGKPYRNGGPAMINWNARGLKTAVHHYGTVNHAGDKDTAWTVEMAIPFSALGFYNWNLRPQENTRWRINFSRVQWDWDVVNGSYVKRKGKNGRPLPEHNWVWSPQGIVDMHAPERWGNLWFRAQDNSNMASPSPEDEKARRLLWEVYYKQQQYRRQKGKYANSLNDLGLPNIINGGGGKQFDIEMEAISRQFSARVELHNSQLTWSIDQEGRITNDK
jgi:hypothetical protein